MAPPHMETWLREHVLDRLRRPLDPRGFGVPRRFTVGTMLAAMLLYAILFSLLVAIEVPPEGIGTVALFVTFIGLSQAVLFGGRHPLRASALTGAVIGYLGIVLFVAGTMGGPRGRLDGAALLFVVILPAYVAFFAFMLGAVIACFFWLINEVFPTARPAGAAAQVEADADRPPPEAGEEPPGGAQPGEPTA